MLGHPKGCGRATPILKYLNYSENYHKKTDEYFSIILFEMSIVQDIFNFFLLILVIHPKVAGTFIYNI